MANPWVILKKILGPPSHSHPWIKAAARVSLVAWPPFTSIHFVFFSVLDRTCEGAVTATGFPGNRSGLDALPDLTSGSSSCESRNLYIYLYIYAICLCQVLVNLLLGILPRHTKTDNGVGPATAGFAWCCLLSLRLSLIHYDPTAGDTAPLQNPGARGSHRIHLQKMLSGSCCVGEGCMFTSKGPPVATLEASSTCHLMCETCQVAAEKVATRIEASQVHIGNK